MMRKMFPILLVLALLMSVLPVAVMAEEPEDDLSWLKDWTGTKLVL